MAERYREVMRRLDDPKVYFPASKQMRARVDVLELAWLDTQTGETWAHDAPFPPDSFPPPAAKSARTAKTARRKSASKPAPVSTDDLLGGLDRGLEL